MPAENVPGQLSIEGRELREPTFSDRRYYSLCCDNALVEKPHTCVCAFITYCPEHGRRHNGTHD